MKPSLLKSESFLLFNAYNSNKLLKEPILVSKNNPPRIASLVGRDKLLSFIKDEARPGTISNTQLVITLNEATGQHVCTQDFATNRYFQITRANDGFIITNKYILKCPIFIPNEGGAVRELDEKKDSYKFGRQELIRYLNPYYKEKSRLSTIASLISGGLLTIDLKKEAVTIKPNNFFKITDAKGNDLMAYIIEEDSEGNKVEKQVLTTISVEALQDGEILIGNAPGRTLLNCILSYNPITEEIKITDSKAAYHYLPDQTKKASDSVNKKRKEISQNRLNSFIITVPDDTQNGRDEGRFKFSITKEETLKELGIQNICFTYYPSNEKIAGLVNASDDPVFIINTKNLRKNNLAAYIPEFSSAGDLRYIQVDTSQKDVEDNIFVLPPGSKLVNEKKESQVVVGKEFSCDPIFKINKLFSEIFAEFGCEYNFNTDEMLSRLMSLKGINETTKLTVAITNDLGGSKGADNDLVSRKGSKMTEDIAEIINRFNPGTKVEFGGDGGTGSVMADVAEIAQILQFLAEKDLETIKDSDFSIRTGVIALNPQNLVEYLESEKTDLKLTDGQINKTIIPKLKQIAEIYSNLLQSTGKASGTSDKAKTVINFALSNLYYFNSNAQPYAAAGTGGVNKQPPQFLPQGGGEQTNIGIAFENLVYCHPSETVASADLGQNITSARRQVNHSSDIFVKTTGPENLNSTALEEFINLTN